MRSEEEGVVDPIGVGAGVVENGVAEQRIVPRIPISASHASSSAPTTALDCCFCCLSGGWAVTVADGTGSGR